MAQIIEKIVAGAPYATIERVPFFGYYLLKLLDEKQPNSVSKNELDEKIPTFVLDCIINIFQKKDIIKVTDHGEADDKRTKEEKIQIELTGNGKRVYEALKNKIIKPEDELRNQLDKFIDTKLSHLKENLKEKRDSIFDSTLDEYKVQVRKELCLNYSDTQNSLATSVKRELQSDNDYKSLHIALIAHAFVLEVYYSFLSKLSEENKRAGLEEVNLFLDTDVLISILTKCDLWYGSTHSMLHTIGKLKNHESVMINVFISRKTLDEFWAVLRTVGRIVNAIMCDKETQKNIYNNVDKIRSEYSFSPIVEFFMGYWQTYEQYTNDILRRFQNMINQYNIQLTSSEEELLPKSTEVQILDDMEKYINKYNIKGRGKKEVIYHDFYILNLVHKKMDSNRTKNRYWLWTYDRNISSNIEKPYLGKTGGTVSNLFLLPLLEILDFSNSTITHDEMLEFAQDYYHLLFSKEENSVRHFNELREHLIHFFRYIKEDELDYNPPNLFIDKLQSYQEKLPEEFDLLKNIFDRTEAVLFT